MTQALYAHINNKTIKKILEKREGFLKFGLQFSLLHMEVVIKGFKKQKYMNPEIMKNELSVSQKGERGRWR
jgi:hypothetical protein